MTDQAWGKSRLCQCNFDSCPRLLNKRQRPKTSNYEVRSPEGAMAGRTLRFPFGSSALQWSQALLLRGSPPPCGGPQPIPPSLKSPRVNIRPSQDEQWATEYRTDAVERYSPLGIVPLLACDHRANQFDHGAEHQSETGHALKAGHEQSHGGNDRSDRYDMKGLHQAVAPVGVGPRGWGCRRPRCLPVVCTQWLRRCSAIRSRVG